jgi:Arylsulfotransferase (ASST)
MNRQPLYFWYPLYKKSRTGLYYICFVFALVCLPGYVNATVVPEQNARLNYTQVMFEFDPVRGADLYQLHVFEKGSSPVLTKRVQSLACLISDGLYFGGRYEWHYTAFAKGKLLYKSPKFAFSIEPNFLVAKDRFRYTILQSTPNSYQDNLLFIDHLGVALNRKGQPVWFMPFDSAAYKQVPVYRNLAMTHTGTFTFLRGEQCFEKDMQGRLIWQGPSDGAVSGAGQEWYHHDFIKAKDGAYYVASYQYDSVAGNSRQGGNIQVRFNTLIQYDSEGRVLWSWNEKDHVPISEILNAADTGASVSSGTHLNGFAWNEKENRFVLSFRNNSTLLKIDKGTGDIVYRIRGDEGNPFNNGSGFFGQHSPVYTPEGNLLLYNNNTGSKKNQLHKQYPKVMLIDMPDGKRTPRMLWEYSCVMKEYPDGHAGKEGYAEQLPNKNILVNIGGANKIMEITRAGKVVWEMNCERYNPDENKWAPFTNYRTHTTSSLYPQYFTAAQLNGDWTLSPAQKSLVIRLNNDGTEKNTFTIEWFSNKQLKAYKSILTLQPGEFRTITIPVVRDKKIQYPNKLLTALIITPSLNPAGAKNYTITVGK